MTGAFNSLEAQGAYALNVFWITPDGIKDKEEEGEKKMDGLHAAGFIEKFVKERGKFRSIILFYYKPFLQKLFNQGQKF